MPKATKSATHAQVPPTIKGDDAEALILNYLKRQNRPHGATDVSCNLKNQVSKGTAQKVLTALAEKGLLLQKTYGKQTVFATKQDPSSALSSEALKELQKENEQRKERIIEVKDKVKRLERELADINVIPTTEELPLKNAELEDKISSLEGRLSLLRSGRKPLTAGELKALEKSHAFWSKVTMPRGSPALWGTVRDNMDREEVVEIEENLGFEMGPDPEVGKWDG